MLLGQADREQSKRKIECPADFRKSSALRPVSSKSTFGGGPLHSRPGWLRGQGPLAARDGIQSSFDDHFGHSRSDDCDHGPRRRSEFFSSGSHFHGEYDGQCGVSGLCVRWYAGCFNRALLPSSALLLSGGRFGRTADPGIETGQARPTGALDRGGSLAGSHRNLLRGAICRRPHSPAAAEHNRLYSRGDGYSERLRSKTCCAGPDHDRADAYHNRIGRRVYAGRRTESVMGTAQCGHSRHVRGSNSGHPAPTSFRGAALRCRLLDHCGVRSSR